MPIWIGTAILDGLFSYPQRRKLSSSCFPIHFMAARVRPLPHVGPTIYNLGSAAYAQVMGFTCVSKG